MLGSCSISFEGASSVRQKAVRKILGGSVSNLNFCLKVLERVGGRGRPEEQERKRMKVQKTRKEEDERGGGR